MATWAGYILIGDTASRMAPQDIGTAADARETVRSTGGTGTDSVQEAAAAATVCPPCLGLDVDPLVSVSGVSVSGRKEGEIEVTSREAHVTAKN
jgi:hypothetical protein